MTIKMGFHGNNYNAYICHTSICLVSTGSGLVDIVSKVIR